MENDRHISYIQYTTDTHTILRNILEITSWMPHLWPRLTPV